jgi:hypothetical protein
MLQHPAGFRGEYIVKIVGDERGSDNSAHQGRCVHFEVFDASVVKDDSERKHNA